MLKKTVNLFARTKIYNLGDPWKTCEKMLMIHFYFCINNIKLVKLDNFVEQKIDFYLF